jgi:hypothetical protein
MDAASATSTITGVNLEDASEASLSASSSLRTPASTANPWRSRCRAAARPMPVEHPVIKNRFIT